MCLPIQGIILSISALNHSITKLRLLLCLKNLYHHRHHHYSFLGYLGLFKKPPNFGDGAKGDECSPTKKPLFSVLEQGLGLQNFHLFSPFSLYVVMVSAVGLDLSKDFAPVSCPFFSTHLFSF